MEIGVFELVLLTLFNAVVCITLPRIITLNWSQIFTQFNAQQERKPETITLQ